VQIPPPGPTAPEPAAGRRRRWWAISADPDLDAISPGRAYAEVLFVYLCFFAVGIIAAALLLGGRSKDFPQDGSWGTYMASAVQMIADMGLAVAVVLLLASRRGVSPQALGLRVPRRPDGRFAAGQSVRIVAWVFLAIIVGDVPNALLQSGSLPKPTTNAPELIFSLFNAAQAGVIEELVVLAFVVVTLRQARRPWWEVTVVALVLRAAYHIYYGPGVVGIILWALLMYWIYLRFRQVVPMILTHAVYDGTLFVGQRFRAAVVVGVLLVLAIWITAGITWLVERNAPSPGRPPALPLPLMVAAGWYPDPGGQNCWRWWDGRQWTWHVSHHPTG
jgi:hypothetical protein